MSTIMKQSIDHVNQRAGAAADPADPVYEAVHAVMHLYRSHRQRGTGGDGTLDLTHMEHKVLGFFMRHPGATQSQLAAHAGRDKGQLARLVGGLKERGLLEARVDEGDRRNVQLQPTAAARAVQQAAQRQARRVAAAAVAGLSHDERAQLVALLQRVQANLESGA
jgi:DNA-binding MarR family transcriptional regulator